MEEDTKRYERKTRELSKEDIDSLSERKEGGEQRQQTIQSVNLKTV